MKSEKKIPPAPAGLSYKMKTWWREINKRFILESWHLRVLESACRAWDRAEQARRELDNYGSMTYTDKAGRIISHPLVMSEKQARQAFVSYMKTLNLDLEETKLPGAPPGGYSKR